MRSKQLIFCLTAAACIAVAGDASAQDSNRDAGKPMRATAGAKHATPNTIHANQQGMSGMRGKAGNRSFAAEERMNGTRAGNRNFAAEQRINATRAGNRNFTAEERTTRASGYEGDRMYESRERFAGTRGFNDNRTFVNRDRVGETRSNRTYMTSGYAGATYGGYGRTWRGDRFVGTGAVVATDVGVGPNYGYPGYGYGYSEYPGSAYGYGGYPGGGYGYGVGVGTGGLYAYAPGYGVGFSSGGLYDYAPGYGVGYTTAPLYSYAPGSVSTVGYARGCRCSP